MSTLRVFIFLILFNNTGNLCAQSCCSGGVPLSANIGLPAAEPGTLQLNLSYDYNNLNTLKSGWEKLNDDSRERTTHSALLSWGISINKKFSIEGIWSYLWQARKVTQTSTDLTQTNGVGDGVLMLNYKLWNSKNKSTSWRAAIGAKTPLGANDRRNDQGIVVNAELQPGSGAWDAIFWTQLSHHLSVRPSATFNATMAYSYKGKNKEYKGDETYQFGREWQISTGISDRWLIWNKLVDPGLSFRYRLAGADKFNEGPLPSTGGQWLFVHPSITYWLQPDLSFNFSITVPLMAYVKDTQFSPTLRTNIGMFYRFGLWEKKVEIDFP